MTQQLQQIIESAWEDRASFNPSNAPVELRQAVAHVLEQLDSGALRVAQKLEGAWQVNQWIKKPYYCHFA